MYGRPTRKWDCRDPHIISLRPLGGRDPQVGNHSSRAIRSLRFNWIQNPEVILNEKLQTVGLNTEYLKSDPELFEVFRKKLYCKLNKRYRRLVDLIVPIYFGKQIKII